MFRAVLYTQWKWARLPMGIAVVTAFAIPVLSVQSAGLADTSRFAAADLLAAMRGWGLAYPLLAAGVGLLLAATAWSADHRGGHVYSLALPIPRRKLALLRFAAGVLLLAAPVLGLTIGSLAAAVTAPVPEGLTTYPVALTVRFALASLVAYSVFFAISAGTVRTAGIILLAVAALVGSQAFLKAAGMDYEILEPVVTRLITAPGPLAVFGGRWMLIDV